MYYFTAVYMILGATGAVAVAWSRHIHRKAKSCNSIHSADEHLIWELEHSSFLTLRKGFINKKSQIAPQNNLERLQGGRGIGSGGGACTEGLVERLLEAVEEARENVQGQARGWKAARGCRPQKRGRTSAWIYVLQSNHPARYA